jgi:hypothetical protein
MDSTGLTEHQAEMQTTSEGNKEAELPERFINERWKARMMDLSEATKSTSEEFL